jgi:mannose-6-phosphate isomerase class I
VTVSDHDESNQLKNIFSNFMRAPDDLVHAQLDALVGRLVAAGPVKGSLDALIVRLNTDFPNDRGALCPLILNYINLKPGKPHTVTILITIFLD